MTKDLAQEDKDIGESQQSMRKRERRKSRNLSSDLEGAAILDIRRKTKQERNRGETGCK